MPWSKARPIIPCEDCGKPIRRKANPAIAQLCLECGVRHGLQAAQQMKAKKGPYYERWLAAMSRRGAAESKTGGKQ